MRYEYQRDRHILDEAQFKEHTSDQTYQVLEGFVRERHHSAQNLDPYAADRDTACNSLTAEDVIRAAKQQHKFARNTLACDLLILFAVLVSTTFVGGIVLSTAITSIRDSVEQLGQELPTYPTNSTNRAEP